MQFLNCSMCVVAYSMTRYCCELALEMCARVDERDASRNVARSERAHP